MTQGNIISKLDNDATVDSSGDEARKSGTFQPYIPIITPKERRENSGRHTSLRTLIIVFCLGTMCVLGGWFIALWKASIFFPWFIYPITCFTVAISFQIQKMKNHDHSLTKAQQRVNWFYFHLSAYITVNVTIVLTWIFTNFLILSTFPWFLYPLFLSSIALHIHYCRVFIPDKVVWLHIGIYLLSNTILAIIWLNVDSWAFPWFVIILCIWGIFFRNRNSSKVHEGEKESEKIKISNQI